MDAKDGGENETLFDMGEVACRKQRDPTLGNRRRPPDILEASAASLRIQQK